MSIPTTTTPQLTVSTAPASILPLPAPSAASAAIATALLAYLSPLFPGVAAAARTEEGAAWWITSWATQIEAEKFGPRRIAGTLTLLGQLGPDVPLSWPRFADLVRQHQFIEPCLQEDDHEERQRAARRGLRRKYPGARFPQYLDDE
jgi:hypothetical protein